MKAFFIQKNGVSNATSSELDAVSETVTELGLSAQGMESRMSTAEGNISSISQNVNEIYAGDVFHNHNGRGKPAPDLRRYVFHRRGNAYSFKEGDDICANE